jgi:hypothetical protein
MSDGSEVQRGIDEHSFCHQDMVHTVTEVKQHRVLGVLRDDRIATLQVFLKTNCEEQQNQQFAKSISTAMAATKLESMPPESPITTCLKPFLRT